MREDAVSRQPSAVSVLLSVTVLLLALPCPARTQQIPYGVGRWESDSTGNHRAVVRVGAPAAPQPGDAVRVHVPWRRRDQHPELKRIVVVAAATGERVANVARIAVTREAGDVVFQPVAGPGDYWLYWMPYQGTFRSSYPRITYRTQDSTASAEWLARHQLTAQGLSAEAWRSLPEAQVVAFEAVDSMSAMWPMEVIATAEETRALLARHPDSPYLLFPEDRTRSIRMTEDLPQRWIGVDGRTSGQADTPTSGQADGADAAGGPVTGTARRGEFFAFQVGVWAARRALEGVAVRFGDLRRGADIIPAAAFSSFNTQGVDWQGRRFTRRVGVPQGRIQALWMGVEVPDSAAPGVYEGTVTVAPEGLAATSLPVRLTVSGAQGHGGTGAQRAAVEGAIPDHGDDEPWRLSRLRWLDSRLALDTGLVPPYTAVTVDDARRQVSILGRTVTLDASGFPRQVVSRFTEEMTSLAGPGGGRALLAAPVRFVVEDSAGRALPWRHAGVRFTRRLPGAALWEARSTAAAITAHLAAQLDFDGNIEYTVRLTASRPTAVRDLRLEIPFAADVARYLMGMGRKGGARPDTMTWRWGVAQRNQDAAWIGDVNAGLQFTLKDERYVRPLNTNFYTLRPLATPASWDNDGQGGCRFGTRGTGAQGHRGTEERTGVPAQRRTDVAAAAAPPAGTYLVTCYSGARTIRPGDTLYYNLRLLLTPFHTLDTRAQWATRYFHAYKPIDTVRAAGANTINIHHANAINPYINYPFLRPDAMQAYIDSAHAAAMRAKIYYTVRELTNRAPELWMLRSLGDEVLASGPGGGHSWLQEHVGGDYITGWVVPELRDVALVTSGISRWHNFYIEGLQWLTRHVGIDGLYLDDVAFDRITMQRIRRVLDRNRPGALIDLHSANQYNRNDGFASSANLYLEHFPYIDRLWFGEYFDYDAAPDYWLTEMSGIPFGLMGEMLQDGGNPWRGMVFGMTARLPWAGDPRPVWRAWDEFGMADSRMIGWWVTGRPVRTGREDVLATAYAKPGTALVALASWARDTVEVTPQFAWRALGIDSARATITAPAIANFQPAASFRPGEPIRVAPGKGWMLVLN